MNKSKRQPTRGAHDSVRQFAIGLRKDLTEQERTLWNAIRDRKLNGIKFRRQHPVGKFILDFYASAIHLVIELDGSVHDTNPERDLERDATLKGYGYTVVRFTNDQIDHDLSAVLSAIAQTASSLSKRDDNRERQ